MARDDLQAIMTGSELALSQETPIGLIDAGPVVPPMELRLHADRGGINPAQINFSRVRVKIGVPYSWDEPDKKFPRTAATEDTKRGAAAFTPSPWP